MANHIIGLDHAVIAVRDLAAAAAAFTRLGFTVSPQGVHAEWGTANRCLMLAGTYVELLAAVGEGDPADRVREFTADRDGLMALALGTADAAADVARLRAAGLDVEDPRALSRPVATDSGTKTARFAVAILPPAATPGVNSWLCQHLTPEALRQPGWTEHGNGAQDIASATAVVQEPYDLMPAWDRLIGPAATTPTDNTVTVHTGNGVIFLTRPDDLSQLHPEAESEAIPAPPAIVALALTVADTAAAARLLKANGVEFSRDAEGTIRIPPDEACGVFLEFQER
jgi:catechol 2,3-dioxygenase-like lactoylglutathione lyase family enzyme